MYLEYLSLFVRYHLFFFVLFFKFSSTSLAFLLIFSNSLFVIKITSLIGFLFTQMFYHVILLINVCRTIDVFHDILKTIKRSSYIIILRLNSMSFLRKHTEIIFSYIIGIVSLFTGLIIFINLPLIKQFKGDKRLIRMCITYGNS